GGVRAALGEDLVDRAGQLRVDRDAGVAQREGHGAFPWWGEFDAAGPGARRAVARSDARASATAIIAGRCHDARGRSMDVRAAVSYEAGKPLVIETAQLDG